MINKLIVFEDKTLDPLNKGGVQGHGGVGSKEYQEYIIDQHLVGKVVRVYWSIEGHTLNNNDGSNTYIPSICVKGKLEHKGVWYRVLIEDDTYCYFDFEHILIVSIRSKKSDRPNSIALKSKKNH